MTIISEKLFLKNFPQYIARIKENWKPIFITNEETEEDNLVLLRHQEYQDLLEKINTLQFQAKQDRANKQIQEGKIITKTIEELEKMEETNG